MAKPRFTDEEITKANNVNIMDYIINQGIIPKRVGSNSYKVEGYGGLHINPTKNMWNCFSQNKGGGPIQLVMFLRDKTWVDAVKELIVAAPSNTPYKRAMPPEQINEAEKKGKLILPEKNNTYKHIIAYLIKTRKIDKEIVYKLIQDGKLYEDKYRNCVFVGYDKNNTPCYASKRGTNTNKIFKGDVENSNKAYPFCVEGTSNKVHVFEGPIEVMSYLTLFKRLHNYPFKDHAISLGCLGDVGLVQYLKDNPNINEITFCLNNDKWGIDAANRFKEKYKDKYSVKIERPIYKDFNEDLQIIFTDTELAEGEDVQTEKKYEEPILEQ